MECIPQEIHVNILFTGRLKATGLGSVFMSDIGLNLSRLCNTVFILKLEYHQWAITSTICYFVIINNDRVKEDEMLRACYMDGGEMNAYRILVGKPEIRRPLGRPRLCKRIILRCILEI